MGLCSVEGCARLELTKFTVQRITSSQASGIANAKERARVLVRSLIPELGQGKFAAVQARELWSTEESIHLRPGHYWVLELGDAGQGSPILKTFEKRETYRGIRFDPGESAIVVKHWLNRTAADATGLTFVKWQETEHDEMIFNSCELRAVGFPLEQIGGQTQSQPSTGAGRPSAGTRRLQSRSSPCPAASRTEPGVSTAFDG